MLSKTARLIKQRDSDSPLSPKTKASLWGNILKHVGCRTSKRLAHRAIVQVFWRDQFGDGMAHAVSLNVSPGGVAVKCLEPIPLKREVSIRIGSESVLQGVVRYCVSKDDGYLVGLEFTDIRRRVVSGRRRDEIDMAIDGMTW